MVLVRISTIWVILITPRNFCVKENSTYGIRYDLCCEKEQFHNDLFKKWRIMRETVKVLTLTLTALISMAGEMVCKEYVYHMWKLRWAGWGRLSCKIAESWLDDLISQSSHGLSLGTVSRLFARCLVHPFIMREKSWVPNPSGWWSAVSSLDHLLRRTSASNSDPFPLSLLSFPTSSHQLKLCASTLWTGHITTQIVSHYKS